MIVNEFVAALQNKDHVALSQCFTEECRLFDYCPSLVGRESAFIYGKRAIDTVSDTHLEYRVVAAEVEERHGFVVALLELEKKIDAEREDVHEVDVHFRDVTRHFLDHFLLDGKRFVSHDDGGFHHIDVIQLPEMLVDAFDERTVPFGRVRQIEFLGETVALAKPAWTLEYIFVVHADRDRPYIELDVLPRFDAKIHGVLLFFRSIFPHVGCHALRLRAPSDLSLIHI